MSKPKGTIQGKNKYNPNGVVALKHKTVIKNLIKKVGKNGTASMREAGEGIYSKSYMESGNILKTDNWVNIMSKACPDELLARMNKKLLEKKRVEIRYDPDSGWQEYKSKEIDVQAVKAGLELAHRTTGKNSPESFIVEQKGIKNMSDAELAELIKKQKARFNKTD